ncbi:hypothetical protein G4B88_016236 [Cannabis sativa]|uniref:Aquaporin NIP5-1 n=1 Tax=Cannabis sativa TaxID=3483 RepID=A0A7J6FQT5_CANSA|nr:hypothetical protein G4B88_016236 [Cannabis sativa]
MPGINCLRALTDSNISLARKLGAEFVGTFILVFSAAGGPLLNNKYNGVETLMGNAACAGLAAMVAIFAIGHISGAHINPAVTIAFAALRHFPWAHVPGYIIVQVSGSISASFALKAVFHPFMSGGVTVPSPGISNVQVFMLEFIVTFFLMFIITAVATDTRAANNRSFNESCTDVGASNCERKLQRNMDVHGGSTPWGHFRGCYLHRGQALPQTTNSGFDFRVCAVSKPVLSSFLIG